MASRWGRLLVAAAIVVAPPAAAQRVTELGLQATGTFSEPALAVAGATGAVRLSERGRLALMLGVGGSDGDFAWRGEAAGHFLLSPRRRQGVAAYGGGGVAVVGGPVERGYLLLTLGLESAPGSRSGWFAEAGVGGGVRLAAGWRWRRFPAGWALED
ncbi:MAG: hypothetical protein ACJ8DJ_15965 [Gemmatimonadales bacterium]|jgi:hypothetical protein